MARPDRPIEHTRDERHGARSARAIHRAILPVLGILALWGAASCDESDPADGVDQAAQLCDRYRQLTESAGCTYHDCDAYDEFGACPSEGAAVLDCWEAALAQCTCKTSGELDCEAVACQTQIDVLDACLGH